MTGAETIPSLAWPDSDRSATHRVEDMDIMSHRSITALIAGIIMVCGAAFLGSSAMAQSAQVHFEPAQITVGEGSTSAVSIRVEDVQKLYGLDIRLEFDPTVVEVVDSDESTEGVQVRPGDLLKLDFLVRNSADNANGTVWFALAQMNPSEEVTGSGDAFVVTFRGLRKGATSPLKITYVKMSNRMGESIPANAEDGGVSVVEAASAPATPTAAAALPSPTLLAPTQPPATATPIRPTATNTPILPTATDTPVMPTATATLTTAPTDTPASTATQAAQQPATATLAPALPTYTSAPTTQDGQSPTPEGPTDAPTLAPTVQAEATAQPAAPAQVDTPTPPAVAAAVNPPTSTPQGASDQTESRSVLDEWTLPFAILAALGGMAFLVVVAILGVIVWRAARRPAQ
jgi:hypothetical protein